MLICQIRCLMVSSFLFDLSLQMNSFKDYMMKQSYINFKSKFMQYELTDMTQNIEKLLTVCNAFIILKNIRKERLKQLSNQKQAFLAVLSLILLIITYVTYNELYVMFSLSSRININNQSASVWLEKMIQTNLFWDYGYLQQKGHTLRPNTIFFIISGLSYKELQKPGKLKDVFDYHTQTTKDGQLLKIRSEIPATDATNWISMFTGMPVEFHSQHHNGIRDSMQLYDSIFERANPRSENVKSIIYGSKYFEEAIFQYVNFGNCSQNYDNNTNVFINENTFDLNERKKFLKEVWIDQPQINSFVLNFYQNVAQVNEEHQVDFQRITIEDALEDFNIRYEMAELDYNLYLQTIAKSSILINMDNIHKLTILQDDALQEIALMNGKDNTYYQLQDQVAEYVDFLIKSLSNDGTILIITSDHGNIECGGSGGDDPDATEIPLFIYRYESDMYKPENLQKEYDMIDIASTLSIMIGVPIPKQNLGSPIQEILEILKLSDVEHQMHLKDLVVQKDEYFRTVRKIYENSQDQDDDEDDIPFIKKDQIAIEKLQQQNPDIVFNTIEYYQKENEKINESIKNWMWKTKVLNIIQEYFNNLIIFGIYTFCIFLVLQIFTCVDVLSLVSLFSSESKTKNYEGFIDALIIFVTYNLIFWIIFIIVFYGYKEHTQFDTAMVSSPLDLLGYFWVTQMIPLIFGICLFRLPLIMNCHWKQTQEQIDFMNKEGRNIMRNKKQEEEDTHYYDKDDIQQLSDSDLMSVDHELNQNYEDYKKQSKKSIYQGFVSIYGNLFKTSIESLPYKDDAMARVFLTKVYLQLFIIGLYMLILLAQSSFRKNYLIFGGYTDSIIFYTQWNTRFFYLTWELMWLFPLWMNTFAFYSWPQANLNLTLFDSLYMLIDYKNKRIQKDKFNSADLKLLKTGLTEFSVFYENTEKFSHEKKQKQQKNKPSEELNDSDQEELFDNVHDDENKKQRPQQSQVTPSNKEPQSKTLKELPETNPDQRRKSVAFADQIQNQQQSDDEEEQQGLLKKNN